MGIEPFVADQANPREGGIEPVDLLVYYLAPRLDSNQHSPYEH